MLTPDAGRQQVRITLHAIRTALVATVLVALAACDSATAPHATQASGIAASLTSTSGGKKITCPGKSGGDCDMTVSVLMERDGDARLIVRTGGYDEATGEHEPNGTFEKVQYKIYDAKGKLLATRNDDASGVVYMTKLPGTFKAGQRVEVQANIKNHSGKKGTAVVRDEGVAAYLPDIDLSAESIEVVVNGQRQPLSTVPAGVSNTYVVDLANVVTVGGTPSTTGIKALCVVKVDGALQVPLLSPGFSYVSGAAQYLAPGETGTCSFTLTLASGAHHITVTAVAADLFVDANVANNSTTGQVKAGAAAPAADLSVARIERLVDGSDPVGGPALGTIQAGLSVSFAAWIASPPNTATATATCSATLDGQPIAADKITWQTEQVTVNGGGVAECRFTLDGVTAGTHTLVVNATSATDPNHDNDSATGTFTVVAAPTNHETVNLGVTMAQPAPIVGSSITLSAQVGVGPGGTQGSAAYVCTATARRVGDNAPATIVPVTMNGNAGPANGPCTFTVNGMSAQGSGDASYRITVTVTPTGINEFDATDNTITVIQVVRATTDLVHVGHEMVVGSGAPQSVTSINRGKTASYRVRFHNSSPTTATSSCTVSASVNSGLPVPVAVTSVNPMVVAPGQDFICTFDYAFTTLAVVKFTVAATNVSPLELTPEDNFTEFTTTSVSDHTFPGITSTNVHILQGYRTDAGGEVVALNEQSVDITRITLTFTETQDIIGDFKLMGVVRSGSNTLSSATWTVNDLTPGRGGFPSCRAGVDAGATSIVPATFTLKICAQQVPGDTITQAIYIEYATTMNTGSLDNPNPLGLFGDNASFMVNLDWTLHGSTVPDHAGAELLFNIGTSWTGIPGVYQKFQTGEVTVIRNGGA